MRTNLFRASALTCIAILGAASLSGCGATSANRSGPAVGGDYLVYNYGGLSARGGQPAVPAARWTADEYADLQELDMDCRVKMAPQIPSAAAEIGSMALKIGIPTALGAGIGTGLGAVEAFTGVTFSQYAKYGALSGGGSALGSGIGSGIDRVQLARRYVQYACMQYAVSHSQKNGRLDGIGIIPWAGSTGARRIAAPGPAGPGDVYRPGPQGDNTIPPSALPPL